MNKSDDLIKICRTCLTENRIMRSLFNVEEFIQEQKILYSVLITCVSVEIYEGDGLPENICFTCIEELKRVFLFRQLCLKSESTLRKNADTQYCDDSISIQNFECGSSGSTINNHSIEQDDIKEVSLSLENQRACESIETNEIKEQSSHDLIETMDTKEDSQKEVFAIPDAANYNNKHKCKLRYVKRRKKFICEHCGMKFLSASFLSDHLLIHTKAKQKQKTGVKGKTKQNNRLGITVKKNKTDIIKQHNQPKTCDICNKTFRFHSNLNRHRIIHTGEKPFLCNVCGRGFAQMAYLKIHSFIHTGEKPYKCNMCEKGFSAPGTLMTHIRTHTGERPHICDICGKDFNQSGYLKAHKRTHTGEKPIECGICHQRFNQSGRLIIHMRRHSGEKPYVCEQCGRSFAVKGTLKKHQRIHTGEKPYICSVCGQAFTQNGTLATHMKIHKDKLKKNEDN